MSKQKITTVSITAEQKEKANKLAFENTGSTGLTAFTRWAIEMLWKERQSKQ
jgi:hypothetical protein